MIRRRRRQREIPFSFDSFLDVVANVVGIIIRLILVAWVGARSYSSLATLSRPTHPSRGTPVEVRRAEIREPEVREPEDPLRRELDQHRRDLAEAQARLLEQLRQLEQTRKGLAPVKGELTQLLRCRQDLENEQAALDRSSADQGNTTQTAALSLSELRERQRRLLEEIRAVEQLPPVKHSLRYRTPVSRPVHSEELLFECRDGRVTFLDIASLLAEVRRVVEEKGQGLRTSWQVSDVAGPVGAFQLRYTLERERNVLDAVVAGVAPEARGNFRYGLSEWAVEPVVRVRGETLAQALAENSEFRQVVDSLDPQQTVVTFWVYPDSFALFRQLRDYLYRRDVVVAGRPLPDGMPITCSRLGSLSRGQ